MPTGVCADCHGGLEVSVERLKEIAELPARLAATLKLTHDVCPDNNTVLRGFRVELQIVEITGLPELLAATGATVEAASFVEAIPKIQAELSGRWDRLVEQAALVDDV